MRHRYLYLGVLITVLVVALSARHAIEERAQRKREIEYQKTLHSYSELLKTGMTRREVEEYFSTKKILFRQLCCVQIKEFSPGVYDNVYDDLVKIGQENVPWVCRENNVYIAFQFLGSRKNSVAEASDKLKDLTIYHHLDGCL